MSWCKIQQTHAWNHQSLHTQEFDQTYLNEIRNCNYSQLLHQSAVKTSTIYGIRLPDNKIPEQCTVAQLRDIILARGGTVTINKPELLQQSNNTCFSRSKCARPTLIGIQIQMVISTQQLKPVVRGPSEQSWQRSIRSFWSVRMHQMIMRWSFKLILFSTKDYSMTNTTKFF